MRFIAAGNARGLKLQVQIEADSTAQAWIGADRWAAYHRLKEVQVWEDIPVIKVKDGEVFLTEDHFEPDYQPFPEKS